MQSDPQVMHFIRPPETDEQVIRSRTDGWLQYARENPGYGVWLIESTEHSAVIGYCVVRHVSFTPGNPVELGYIIDPAYWGMGFATEATDAMILYAGQQLGIQTMVAYTDEQNTASNRVLEKCGFGRVGFEQVYDANCLKWIYQAQEKASG